MTSPSIALRSALRPAPRVRVAASHRRRDLVGDGFVLLFLLGLYTGVDLRRGDVLLPYALCASALPYFALRCGHRIEARRLSAIGAIFLISAFSVLLAPEAGAFLHERLKGFVHLVYSVSLSFFVFLYIQRNWSVAHTGRVFGWIATAIILGSALETYGGLRPVSDAVRLAIFDPSFLYFEHERDLISFGQIRPKLFTEEPSYVALFFLLSIFCWFSISQHAHRHMLFILGFAAGFLLIRSPIVLLALPLGVVSDASLRRAGRGGRRARRHDRAYWMRLAGFSVVATLLVAGALVTVLEHRLELLTTGRDLSSITRTVVPALLAGHVLTTHPFVGVGLTGKEFLARDLEGVYGGLGFAVSDPNRIVSAPFLFVIYYGLGAGIAMGFAFFRLMHACGVRRRFFCLVSIGLLTAGMGAFVGMRTWFFIFMAMLVASLERVEAPRRLSAGRSRVGRVGYRHGTA